MAGAAQALATGHVYKSLQLQAAPCGKGTPQSGPLHSLHSSVPRASGPDRCLWLRKPTAGVCMLQVEAGVISAEELGEELSVQEAYTPQSVCFGCGKHDNASNHP